MIFEVTHYLAMMNVLLSTRFKIVCIKMPAFTPNTEVT